VRDQVEAVASRSADRYRDIEDNDIHAVQPQLLERFLITPRFRNHIEIGVVHEQRPNALANENVVIDDDDIDQFGAPGCPAAESRLLLPNYTERYARI
jgi:hypothetical protein